MSIQIGPVNKSSRTRTVEGTEKLIVVNEKTWHQLIINHLKSIHPDEMAYADDIKVEADIDFNNEKFNGDIHVTVWKENK